MQKKPGSTLSIRDRLTKWYRDRQDDAQLVDYVVETVEPRIKDVRGYRQSLQAPLQICLQYCKRMVAEIPGPVYLKRSNYYADPLINAAFVGAEKIEDLLANLEDSMPPGQNQASSARFALLTMTRTEKTIFGPQQQGNMMISDAAMRTVTFTDHKIVGLATTLESSRNELEQLSLEVIVEAIARELTAQRSHLSELRQQGQSLQAMSRMFGGGTQARSALGHYNPEEQEKLAKVKHLLEENENELVAVREKTEMPKDWLAILASNLTAPEKIMHVQPISLRLDWKNVIISNTDEEAKTITLAQFSLTDELQRDAVLISYEQES